MYRAKFIFCIFTILILLHFNNQISAQRQAVSQKKVLNESKSSRSTPAKIQRPAEQATHKNETAASGKNQQQRSPRIQTKISKSTTYSSISVENNKRVKYYETTRPDPEPAPRRENNMGRKIKKVVRHLYRYRKNLPQQPSCTVNTYVDSGNENFEDVYDEDYRDYYDERREEVYEEPEYFCDVIFGEIVNVYPAFPLRIEKSSITFSRYVRTLIDESLTDDPKYYTQTLCNMNLSVRVENFGYWDKFAAMIEYSDGYNTIEFFNEIEAKLDADYVYNFSKKIYISSFGAAKIWLGYFDDIEHIFYPAITYGKRTAEQVHIKRPIYTVRKSY